MSEDWLNAFQAMIEFVKKHEDDIILGIHGFDELKPVLKMINKEAADIVLTDGLKNETKS